MNELLIDYHIRTWVFVPIVLITLLIGILQHYVSLLIRPSCRPNLQQIIDSQAVRRARLLGAHGHLLPAHSFAMRRHYFNDPKTGFFLVEKRSGVNVVRSPALLGELVKSNVTNVLPMMFIGGWINWIFSGFVTTRVPFPLTRDFKAMLQQDVHLDSLDASWVSSLSWYFLNVFGLRSLHGLIILGDAHQRPLDQTQAQQDIVVNTALDLPEDARSTFKNECETLAIAEYRNVLEEDAEQFVLTILEELEKTIPEEFKKTIPLKFKKTTASTAKANEKQSP